LTYIHKEDKSRTGLSQLEKESKKWKENRNIMEEGSQRVEISHGRDRCLID